MCLCVCVCVCVHAHTSPGARAYARMCVCASARHLAHVRMCGVEAAQDNFDSAREGREHGDGVALDDADQHTDCRDRALAACVACRGAGGCVCARARACVCQRNVVFVTAAEGVAEIRR